MASRALPKNVILLFYKYQTICNRDIIDVHANQMKQHTVFMIAYIL